MYRHTRTVLKSTETTLDKLRHAAASHLDNFFLQADTYSRSEVEKLSTGGNLFACSYSVYGEQYNLDWVGGRRPSFGSRNRKQQTGYRFSSPARYALSFGVVGKKSTI